MTKTIAIAVASAATSAAIVIAFNVGLLIGSLATSCPDSHTESPATSTVRPNALKAHFRGADAQFSPNQTRERDGR